MKMKEKAVSEFNPDQRIQDLSKEDCKEEKRSLVILPLKLKLSENNKQTAVQEKDDSFRRVGFFLEKIKERNSSMQERLNLSFKKSSRLDHSSISYRPTTSYGNGKKLKGTLLDHDCISLNRERETKVDHSDSSRGNPAP